MNASSFLIRVVDDDCSVYDSLRFILEVGGWRTCWYATARDFLEKDDWRIPGALLLDVRMPGMTGVELQHEMQRRQIDLPIVFLSAHADVELAVTAVQNGADDFLIKPPHAEKLLASIAHACERLQNLRALKQEQEEMLRLWNKLNDGEKEVMGLVAKDFGNKEIANLLELKEDAVRSRRAIAFAKLDISNALQLSDFLHRKDQLNDQIAALKKARTS